LAFRWPNLLEPYQGLLYARLRDGDARVRKNTLMVLAHLVLNDMVKVKGQVGELAVCLNDADASIADISRMFFAELAKRPNNPVYNIFPDTLSCLSRLASAPPPVGDAHVSPLSRATLRDILRFLLSFVTKAAQTEALAERLLARLDLAAAQVDSAEERALAADIAFCLSVLPASDRTLRKLCEGVKGYAKALANDNVWDAFSGAASARLAPHARGRKARPTSRHSPARTPSSTTLSLSLSLSSDMLARARRTLGAASGAGAGAAASARQETRALVDAWADALAQARSGGVEDDAAMSGARAAAVRAKRVGAAAGIDVDAQAQAVLVEAANAVAAKKSAAEEASKKAKAVAKPRAPRKKKAAAGGGSDDENDEEVVPKGKARSAGKAAAIIEDDDEDDAPVVKPAGSRSRGGAK
jgi:hypothetical protein